MAGGSPRASLLLGLCHPLLFLTLPLPCMCPSDCPPAAGDAPRSLVRTNSVVLSRSQLSGRLLPMSSPARAMPRPWKPVVPSSIRLDVVFACRSGRCAVSTLERHDQAVGIARHLGAPSQPYMGRVDITRRLHRASHQPREAAVRKLLQTWKLAENRFSLHGWYVFCLELQTACRLAF
jgi:hypothetical protein